MKKILHISTFYPPHMGGIEDVCFNIVRYLATNPDVEQRVVCFNDSKFTMKECYDGVEVMRVGRIASIASQSIALRYAERLGRLMRRFRPDFVHFHAPNPFVAACVLVTLPKEVKLIVHWHSDVIAQKTLYKFVKPIETALLRRADTIVATSQRYIDGSHPLQRFREKCVVIPNVVNISKLNKDDAHVREIRRRYGNKPLLLFVGRHVPYKGLDNLLKAISMLKHDCEVIIGGQGPLTQRLRKDYPLPNVHFVGRIQDDLLSAYYHAADVFLFPSITKNEAFGVALAEAMYAATPAITCTIPGSGVNWVNVDGVTGLEVEGGNVEKLAEAIDCLLGDEKLRYEYGHNAHQRITEHMTPDKITDALNSLYQPTTRE